MATTTESVATATRDAREMRIFARFTASRNVTTEQYDETISRLEMSGDWPPEGLDYHVAVRSNGNLQVSEIWDSREEFDASVERLMPVLKDVGIELAGQPHILEIHNIFRR
jgi:hypothetical protein